MKKLILVLASGLLLLVVSCSKADNPLENTISVNPNTNKQLTGSSANDLLSDKKFKRMVVEVVYVAGFEPSSQTITNFVEFLNARTFKPGGINIIKRSIPSTGNSSYTNEEIINLENDNRTRYNTPDEIAIWAFFADGNSDKDSDKSIVLGTAYRNTSFVIFEKTIHGLSDSPFEPNRSLLETTVLTHEFGHLLGLTNLGTNLQSDHEDAAHPKHCINKTCLMYWSSEIGGGIGNMVSSGSAPKLDSQCITDLRANGGR
ncbi:hypothetical protein SAMN05444396_10114 [Flavobacterium segetis]|uniref:Membrane metalloprotease n=1 Tax=Flavobacterium segetis TaxID=271157 RepID=A0A1M5DW90_9FLAO|nr:membrane metalloprotease [Flavobacterium segetis]SHF71263.1 hypothetical protein SAMN05444396_10114 [Flavobacterium segetis]